MPESLCLPAKGEASGTMQRGSDSWHLPVRPSGPWVPLLPASPGLSPSLPALPLVTSLWPSQRQGSLQLLFSTRAALDAK